MYIFKLNKKKLPAIKEIKLNEQKKLIYPLKI